MEKHTPNLYMHGSEEVCKTFTNIFFIQIYLETKVNNKFVGILAKTGGR